MVIICKSRSLYIFSDEDKVISPLVHSKSFKEYSLLTEGLNPPLQYYVLVLIICLIIFIWPGIQKLQNGEDKKAPS